MYLQPAKKSLTISGLLKRQSAIHHRILVLLLAPLATFSQTDTEFWFVAPEVSKHTQNFDIPIYLRISTFALASTVTVSQPANPSFAPIVLTVPANGFSTVNLSSYLDMVENKPPNTILNYGIHITATDPVSIYYEVASTYCNCNPELFSLKGKNAVGTNFIIPTQNFFSNSSVYSPMPYNGFDIVATKDNTVVSITPSKDIVGHAAGITFDIHLNTGETWSAVATSQEAAEHLWGSVVTSTKPVTITMKDDLLFGITGCADLVGDQIVPVEITGTEYVVVKGNLTNDGNRAYIIATQDNTEVYIDGNAVPVTTLATGQLYNHNILNPSTFISTNHPAYVFQTSGFGCELGGALLPSVTCTGSTQVTFTRTTLQQLGVVIATQVGNIGNFLVNGDPSLITALNFSPVPGTGGNWQAASLTFSLAQIPEGTVVSVTNTTGNFHLGLMIGNPNDGCSYGYFSDFSRLNLGPDLTICPGDSTTLSAGSGWSTYLWNTNDTTATITVKNGGNYVVTVSDPTCTLSDTVNVSLFTAPLVDLGPDDSLCSGLTDTLSPSGGPFMQYLWNTGATTPSLIISSPGIYSLAVTDINGCTAADTITIIADPGPVVTNSPLSDTICSADTIDIILTANRPSTAFLWIASASSPLVTGYQDGSGDTIRQTLYSASTDPETVTYTITPNLEGCNGTPSDYTFTLLPLLPVSVTVTASGDTVCEGTQVIYSATTVNGGTDPAYQWEVNGVSSGANDSIFTYPPASGDQVICHLTSGIRCPSSNPVSSNAVILTVNPLLPVSISVTASANPFCVGNSVTFTATPVNEGTLPIYQWFVNGVATGTSNPVYTYAPVHGDQVYCSMTSSESCASGNPANSNIITMTGDPRLPVGVSIIADPNPFCPGNAVTFKATPVNGGTNPSYQWQVNGINTGTNSEIFTYSPLQNDIVSCVMTSGLDCVTGNPATSDPVVMDGSLAPVVSFNPCFDTIITTNTQPFKLKGGIPLGGVYTGPGVTSETGIFNPSIAGDGTKTITYTYTNAVLCAASAWCTVQSATPPAFSCGNEWTDIRDGKKYPTIQIGGQCWMASNLDFGHQISDLTHQRDNCLPEKYCYGNSSVQCEASGAYYQWDELMRFGDTPGLQGLCPPGWHIPTEADWSILFTNWINNGFAASPLKYDGFSGFNALLSGVNHFNRQWDYGTFATFFWSSTPHGTGKAWAHGMNEYDPSVSTYPAARANAFSARCLKD